MWEQYFTATSLFFTISQNSYNPEFLITYWVSYAVDMGVWAADEETAIISIWRGRQ